MKFTLAKSYLYWWPVTVMVPAPDVPGSYHPEELCIQISPQTQAEAVAANEQLADLRTTRELVEHEITQILTVVRGWEGVVGDDGVAVPYSEEAMRQALQFSWFRNAISAAITASLNGEARVKN